MMNARTIFMAAAALALAACFGASARAQETPATEAQKRHEELAVQQSLDRLQQTRKNLQGAIEKLASEPGANAAEAVPGAPGVALHGPAIQQAEQALLDVRRAIDELNVPQERRQEVLDRLDDADSAMRAARQPDADRERKRLQEALLEVHKEIELAQQTLPETPSGVGR